MGDHENPGRALGGAEQALDAILDEAFLIVRGNHNGETWDRAECARLSLGCKQK